MTKDRKRTIGMIAICSIGICSAGGILAYNVTKENHFQRIVQEDGSIELEGTEDYESLRKYDVLLIETINEDTQVKLAREQFKTFESGTGLGYSYIDLITGKPICRKVPQDDDKTIILEHEDLKEFLIAFDKIKEFYTPEDIEQIITLLEEYYADYDLESSKELIKK